MSIERINDDNSLDKLADIIMQKLESKLDSKIDEIIDRKLGKSDEEDGKTTNTMSAKDAQKYYEIYLDYLLQNKLCNNENIDLFNGVLNNEFAKHIKVKDTNNIYGNLFRNIICKNPNVGLGAKTNYNSEDLDYNNLYNFDDYKVVSNVGRILKAQGKTQTWLANVTGISRGTVVSIINDGSGITLQNAYKISTALELPLQEVFPYLSDQNIKSE